LPRELIECHLLVIRRVLIVGRPATVIAVAVRVQTPLVVFIQLLLQILLLLLLCVCLEQFFVQLIDVG